MSTVKAASKLPRPLGDCVLVKRLDPADKTPGGLHLPDTGKKSTRGTVLAFGPGKFQNGTLVPMPPLCTGDVVWFGAYSGSDVEIDGVEYVVLSADVIFLVDPKVAGN